MDKSGDEREGDHGEIDDQETRIALHPWQKNVARAGEKRGGHDDRTGPSGRLSNRPEALRWRLGRARARTRARLRRGSCRDLDWSAERKPWSRIDGFRRRRREWPRPNRSCASRKRCATKKLRCWEISWAGERRLCGVDLWRMGGCQMEHASAADLDYLFNSSFGSFLVMTA